MPDAVETKVEAKRPTSIADLPAQKAARPASTAESRARYFNTGNAFNVILPPVPDMAFTDEPARALDPATPTGLIACDIADRLGCPFPATSPLVLARYARIRAGERLDTRFAASGVIAYVIQGSGGLDCGGETIGWGPGDVVVMPGGVGQAWQADDADAVLWLVTNEPQVAFENLQPPADGAAPTDGPSPQHHTAPSPVRAQLWSPPAATSTAGSSATPVGTGRSVRVPSPSWPSAFSPEHATAPAGVSPHVW